MDPDHFWTGFSARIRVIAYNTTLVKPEEAPQSVFDLASPQWAGQVALADPRFGSTSFHVAALYTLAGDERMDDYFRRLKAQGVRRRRQLHRARPCSPRRRQVGLTGTDDVSVAIEQRQPIGDGPARPGRSRRAGRPIWCRCWHAPHSDGEEVIDYLLSPDVEGQLARSEAVRFLCIERPNKILPSMGASDP
jgi:iron(III) transport system substrate-binding protein